MRIQLPTVIALLAGVVSASPVPKDPNSDVNDCDDIRYENGSSDGSPTVDDCRQIVKNIQDGGSWDYSGVGHHKTLVTYGTCAMGIDSGARVGNLDITDIINGSIDRFEWKGLVGAKGKMNCQKPVAQQETDDVNWSIYFNPDCCK
ncbi:hypothetical protein P168DRAFT_279616 [Aspergillus campestris IBT 28561]|uniref:Ecp2 effector protein-like domain-containing protein n=1 Tax=Aspergillus campestris (strain IBT 28561) TaxID=1392248 RepID=A0A2I1D8E7_ASPC2|nr:uncharacterized protein P168DRAFT_279616 [Aspergillus campestris IBT 28561]PKY06145.1 hypothetical protein P168DRAFT_279616 [Aspergillus campestris IBT 28561]